MSKLTLQFEGITLREYAVGGGVTIGRLPDNGVVVDNPAVSGHHARIVVEGGQAILEDLQSTNGTFVGGRVVSRHALQHGDVVLVGKHQLLFERGEIAVPLPASALQGLGDTVYLDTKQHRALRATLDSARAGRCAAAPERVALRTGTLRVVGGAADLSEYDLEAQTSFVGRSETALVRLRGWFKPAVALAIARSGEGYVVTAMGGKPTVNDTRLVGRHPLEEGDVLQVCGLSLEFRWKRAVAEPAA